MVNNVADWAKDLSTLEDKHPEVGELQKALKKAQKIIAERETNNSILIDILKTIYKTPPTFVFPPSPKLKLSKGGDEVAVLHISDTQIGKDSPSYNTKIASDRLLLLAEKTVRITEIRRAGSDIDEILVLLGGDIVEGEEIFSSQPYEIDSDVLTQAVKTAPAAIVNVLLYLLANFKKVRVSCCRGNHGRVGKGTGSPKTNWDTVCYHITKYMLESAAQAQGINLKNRLEFKIEDDKFYTVDKVCGWGVLMVHGHQIRGSGGVFPISGATRKVFGWIDSIEENFNYMYLGHFHTAAMVHLNNRVILFNGTTESSNAYAQEELAATGYPCQRLSFFNKEHGLISDNIIYLSDRTPII
jgi:hypothetical protein